MIITTQVGGIPINRLNESSGCSPSVGKSGGASCVGPDGAQVSGGDAGAGNSSTLHLCYIALPLETIFYTSFHWNWIVYHLLKVACNLQILCFSGRRGWLLHHSDDDERCRASGGVRHLNLAQVPVMESHTLFSPTTGSTCNYGTLYQTQVLRTN